MQKLGFSISPAAVSPGYTLVELLVSVSLLAALAALAMPNWQRLQERNRVDAARDQLVNDLHTARMHALQRGEALQLSRLTPCSWGTSAATDWSCGWQLVRKADQSVLSTSALSTPLLITFAKTTALDIHPRGDLGTVGDRWVIQSRQATLNLASTLCLSSASRLRWQVGTSCS